MISTSILTALLLINFFLFAWLLGLGARLVGAKRSGYPLMLLSALAIFAINLILSFAAAILPNLLNPGDANLERLAQIAALGGMVVFSCLVIRFVVETSFRGAFAAWLCAGIGSCLVALPIAFIVIKPLLTEGFQASANSMAPTIVGWHAVGLCPHCGKQALMLPLIPINPESEPRYGKPSSLGICAACQKAGECDPSKARMGSPDRIMVNKLQAPRRWEIVVFRPPENPELKYVQRLVGLPGEELFLEQGQVWINGVRQSLPPEIAGLEYVSGADIRVGHLGTRDEPFRLKADECCLLGDFSVQSLDSRTRGPVPLSNIEGVVDVCYWPVSRIRFWR